MQDSNFPSQMQTGTKIIVRHRANGDTEYICRPDTGGGDPFFDLFPEGFGRWVWMLLILIGVLWYLGTDDPKQKAAKERTMPEKTEVVMDQ